MEDSPSSKEILDKLESVIEPDPARVEEEYKISILVLTIAHGEKIILPSRINSLEDFQKYERDLKRESWYPFVEKTYIYGHAPFGNICLFRNKPQQVWSRLNTKQGLEKLTKRYGVNTTNRKTFVKGTNIINTDFMTESIPDSSMPRYKNIPQKRAPIMARMYKEELSYYNPEEVGKYVPVSGIMNPMTMRLEIVPSIYLLSGKSTDSIEKSIKEDPNLIFNAQSDKYSGIFVSILSDNRGNTFTFPSLFNLADGKHIMEIFQRLKTPIPGIDPDSADGNELYKVVVTYVDEVWMRYNLVNKVSSILDIEGKKNTYYITDKLTQKPKPVSYFMLTKINTMSVYVIANLVFDFLLFKQTNPTTPYKKNRDELILWIEELKTKNSKVINISTACESVNPDKMNEKIVQDVASYINAISLHRTETQIEADEGKGPDLIPFSELDNYIDQFKDKVEEYEYEPLRESLKQPISDTFASPLKREIGGRKRRTRKINRKKTNNRSKKNNRRKTNRRKKK